MDYMKKMGMKALENALDELIHDGYDESDPLTKELIEEINKRKEDISNG